MPVLSLHNTYSLPSGSASYTLGLSGAPGASSYTYPAVGQSSTALGLNSVLGASGLSGHGLGASMAGHSSLLSSGLGTTGLNLHGTSSNLVGGASVLTSLGLGYNTSSYSTYTNPLITSGAMKLKTLDDFDIGISRYNRVGTPCSPIPPAGWGLDSYSGIDGVNPAFMHSQSRPLSRLGGLDGLDGELTCSLTFELLFWKSLSLAFLFTSFELLRKSFVLQIFFSPSLSVFFPLSLNKVKSDFCCFF
jgi:RIMS-binding protein 2